ncbi:MAG: hypothetical protein IJT34_04225, partial [Butyrivibrio sp.]|nr:hypothetical protein [Butyrivibrio sp.]
EMRKLKRDLRKSREAMADVIAEKDSVIAEKDSAIAERDDTIARKNSEIAALRARLEEAGL